MPTHLGSLRVEIIAPESEKFTAPMLLVLLITIGVNVYLIWVVPKGFFPQQDTGRLAGGIQGAQDSSFTAMKQRMARFVDIIKADPAVANVVAFTGSGGGTTTNTGRMFIALKPLEERKISADQVIGRLRRQLATVEGASLVCKVLTTKWPVEAALKEISAVSRSRISPTMTMSGS